MRFVVSRSALWKCRLLLAGIIRRKKKNKHADVIVMDLTIKYSYREFISGVISFISITFVR